MSGFQKYEKQLIITMAFGGHTKTGQKMAARWAGLAVLNAGSSKSHHKISIS